MQFEIVKVKVNLNNGGYEATTGVDSNRDVAGMMLANECVHPIGGNNWQKQNQMSVKD